MRTRGWGEDAAAISCLARVYLYLPPQHDPSPLVKVYSLIPIHFHRPHLAAKLQQIVALS